MGKHRRREGDVLLPVRQYEQLVLALHQHRPGERSGLCLSCGINWPCYEIRHAVGAELTVYEHTAAGLPRREHKPRAPTGRQLVQRDPELYRESATGWIGCRPFTDIPPRFHRPGCVQ